MRTITFLIGILITTTTYAQPHFSMGLGYGHAPIVQLNAGYSFGSVMLEYDQRMPTNRSTPGIMGLRAGYILAYSDLHQLDAIAGLHYSHFRAHSTINGITYGGGVQYRYFPPKTAVNSYVGIEAYYLPKAAGVVVKAGLTF